MPFSQGHTARGCGRADARLVDVLAAIKKKSRHG